MIISDYHVFFFFPPSIQLYEMMIHHKNSNNSNSSQVVGHCEGAAGVVLLCSVTCKTAEGAHEHDLLDLNIVTLNHL